MPEVPIPPDVAASTGLIRFVCHWKARIDRSRTGGLPFGCSLDTPLRCLDQSSNRDRGDPHSAGMATRNSAGTARTPAAYRPPLQRGHGAQFGDSLPSRSSPGSLIRGSREACGRDPAPPPRAVPRHLSRGPRSPDAGIWPVSRVVSVAGVNRKRLEFERNVVWGNWLPTESSDRTRTEFIHFAECRSFSLVAVISRGQGDPDAGRPSKEAAPSLQAGRSFPEALGRGILVGTVCGATVAGRDGERASCSSGSHLTRG